MAKSILIFEPYDQGHHAGYILNLLREIAKQDEPQMVYLVIGHAFPEKHPDVVRYAETHLVDRVTWLQLTKETTQSIQECDSAWKAGFLEWRSLKDVLTQCQPDHILCMYLDFLILPLAIGLRLPSPCSGIIFRQNRHYPELFQSELSLKERFLSEIKFRLFNRALANPGLSQVFCLDPYIAKSINSMHAKKLIACPDPVHVPVCEDDASPPAPYSDRKTILLFGVISERKGFSKFLEASATLPESVLQRLDFWIVGPTREQAEENAIESLSKSLKRRGAIVRRENRFVQDKEIQAYFRQSSFVAAPYNRHMGMSAVLVRAAVEHKPILATNFGLLGQLVKSEELGTTFKLSDRASIHRAIVDAMHGNTPYSCDNADRFANRNSPEQFAKTILSRTYNMSLSEVETKDTPAEFEQPITPRPVTTANQS